MSEFNIYLNYKKNNHIYAYLYQFKLKMNFKTEMSKQ